MAFVPKYLLIIGFTIIVDYVAGIYIEKASNLHARKFLLILSLVTNIGVLVFFKYSNFFNANFDKLLSFSSHHSPFPYLNILLPIGLSFHTFQAMSYTIEIYKGNHKAEKHFGIYALYVMFYPQLVAGPIERPQNILWQFHKKHNLDFEQFKSGLMQMAFGLFKKVVIADRLATIVDIAYADPKSQTGLTHFVVAILYSFQIYCDFSGYCDIGIGAARTMGIKLVVNFNAPYFSKSINEFWSRWHISLSTWFRDYLYIPLGGSRGSILRKCFNLVLVFLISGLWHGAKWTFVIWGALHALFLILENLKNNLFKKDPKTVPPNNLIKDFFNRIGIFLLISLAWIFFRSPNLPTAEIILSRIFSDSIIEKFNFHIANQSLLIFSFLLIVFLLIKERFMPIIPTKKNWRFLFSFSSILILCYVFGVFNNKQFIYFQF
ncbi:MAG: MBOAT family O-acyltransferase [Mucilaginibacter sp.]